MDSPESSSQQPVLDSLRTVEFRLTLRGYHIDDVDEYLERVAGEVDALREQARVSADRLRQAAERIGTLEQQLDEARRQPSQPAATAPSDEALQRTLQMAQRFVEQTRSEALAEAQGTVAEAQERAANIVNEAEDRAHRTSEEAQRQLREDVNRLEGVRTQLSADVEAIARHLESERTRLRATLGELSAWVEENLQPAGSLLAPRPADRDDAGPAGPAPGAGVPVMPAGPSGGQAVAEPRTGLHVGADAGPRPEAAPGVDRPSDLASDLGLQGHGAPSHAPSTLL
ncbi:MAG: DivIVA domain-containing protein [Actinomycetota bacterium]|jgi:cell division initiation protein|nr:DivIVA domain-containing protein [Actinomycetota bacterium]